MAAKQEEKERFYNGDTVAVTERIEKGKTVFFLKRNEAEVFADQKRSYKYEVFNAPLGSTRTVVGYGVPN